MSVLRAAGRQGLGAGLNIVAYWVVGVPLSALFGLHLDMGVNGFWLGLLLTSSSQAVVQLLVLARFDWQEEVRRAAKLVAEEKEAVLEQSSPSHDAAVEGGPWHAEEADTWVSSGDQSNEPDTERMSLLPQHAVAKAGQASKQQKQRAANSSSSPAMRQWLPPLFRAGTGREQQQRGEEQGDVVVCPSSFLPAQVAEQQGGRWKASSMHGAAHQVQEPHQSSIQHQHSIRKALLQSQDSVDPL